MIRSDAVPIQMWLTDCETYNESAPYGINPRCFCGMFECDDEVKDQFQDEQGQNFVLLIYDDEESLLDSIPYEETSPGVYFLSFIPSDNTPGICDKNIKVQIRKEAGSQGIELPALSDWLTGGPGDTAWTLGSSPTITLTSGNESEYLYVDYAFIVGVTYTIRFNYTQTGTLGRQGEVYITDSLFNILYADAFPNALSIGTHDSDLFTFTAISGMTRINIRASTLFFTSSITINSTTATRSLGTAEIIAKSDCISIKAEQVGSVLINYSNYRNYAGIINNNGSPDLTFNIRIPAVFNEERFPETDEPMQLSNNRFISLNSQVKKQKKLETEQMPMYMHLKVMEVLKHQFVTVKADNKEVDVVKEEPYEQVENSNKRWPMRRYTCWLTEKEYVVRNIL